MTVQRPSIELAERSVAAVLAAIEVYNKPTFSYREDCFSILMANAWELLLKAKYVADNQDDFNSIFVKDHGRPKLSRSGNPLTYDLNYLIEKLHQDKSSGLTKECRTNLLLLIEVRDNAIHFINTDLFFSKRIQEIGTASLKNFLDLGNKWFKLDLSKYNFYLMPLSFFHGFEAIQPVSLSTYSEQIQNFLSYIDRIVKETGQDEISPHVMSLAIETRVVRSKDEGSLPIRITKDPDAPEMRLTEESIRERYPLNYRELTATLKNRYVNFVGNNEYHKLRKSLELDPRYGHRRFLNQENRKGVNKPYYSREIFVEFDKHYERK